MEPKKWGLQDDFRKLGCSHKCVDSMVNSNLVLCRNLQNAWNMLKVDGTSWNYSIYLRTISSMLRDHESSDCRRLLSCCSMLFPSYCLRYWKPGCWWTLKHSQDRDHGMRFQRTLCSQLRENRRSGQFFLAEQQVDLLWPRSLANKQRYKDEHETIKDILYNVLYI